MDIYAENTIDDLPFMTKAKSLFIWNAICDGWTVRKKGDMFVFKKKHHDREEVFDESFLHTFVKRYSNEK